MNVVEHCDENILKVVSEHYYKRKMKLSEVFEEQLYTAVILTYVC